MSGSNRNLPLPQFVHSTLSPLVPIFSDLVPSSTASSQALLKQAADDLYLIGRMISSLGLYSENEEADELGERELLFMATAWVLGEVEGRRGIEVRGSGGGDDSGNREIGLEGRMGAVKRADTAFQSFIHLLISYKILSDEEVSESASIAQNVAPTFGTGDGSAARIAPRDPAKRREEKIRAYKREKELRSGIASALPGDVDPSSHPLAFILPLLPPPGSPSDSEEELPISRATLISLLRLLYTLTLSSLSSNAMELELLSSAPSPSHQYSASSSSHPRDRANAAETDTTWRLDRAPVAQRAGQRHGGLISGGGRVLRPFTILPSTAQMSDRERLKSEVFRSGHALPSMTIDEYLEEEMRRGGIISGGGQASADAPTTSELLQLASENDGTLEGEDKEEEKRLKDENWARFTDENRKGAGNTMNRG